MAWYRTGTVAVTQNSKTITGTNTKWLDATQGIGPGQMLLLPAAGTVVMYEIAAVDSDTQLRLVDAFTGATASGRVYAIVNTYIDSVPDFARRLAAQLAYYQSQLDGWQSILSGTGTINITAPDGTMIPIKSMAEITTAIGNMLDKTKNGSDIPDKAEFRKNLGLGNAVLTDTAQTITASKTFTAVPIMSWANPHIALEDTDIAEGTVGRVGRLLNNGGVLQLLRDPSVGSSTGRTTLSFPTSGTVITEGSYGVGGLGKRLDNTSSVVDQMINAQSGLYASLAATPAVSELPYAGPAYTFASIRFNNTPDLNILAIPMNVNFPISYRSNVNGVKSVWRDTLSIGVNATVDANGFIKTASPIVKLFSDGSVDTNDEAIGVTSEKIGIGEYRISGCLGFNADPQWGGIDGGIEIPLDINKQPLVWAQTSVESDGSIIIRTYHRTHPDAPEFAQNNIEGVESGQPIDIPAGRWVDVRVQMPGSDEPGSSLSESLESEPE